MTVQLWGGVPLLVGGAVAVHADCCCYPDDSCTRCTGSVPNTYTFTPDNISDGSAVAGCTNCDEFFNGEPFLLTLDPTTIPPAGTCTWKYEGVIDGCCSGESAWNERNVCIWALWEPSGGTYQLRVQVFINYCRSATFCEANAIMRWDSGSATPVACAISGTKTLTYVSGGTTNPCATTSITGTIKL